MAENSSNRGNQAKPDLFAAGFNAHGQLDPKTKGKDVDVFHTISGEEDTNVDVLFAGWSTSVFASPARGVWSQGHQKLVGGEAITYETLSEKQAKVSSGGDEQGERKSSLESSRFSAFGDHEGLRGLLCEGGGDSDGCRLYIPESSEGGDQRLTLLTTISSPSVSHIALAGNERVALTFAQAPRSRLCHVVEFESLAKFTAWYRDPSGEGTYPDAHHMLPGRPKRLIAGTATFGLLMEDGEVYSWGDARLGTLGRSISGDGASADSPGMVEALGGLKVVKLACGGWLSAAISEDGALYLWGAMTPGSEKNIRCLREAGAGEVVLVEIPSGDGDSEPLDVLDVAVGDNHIAVVTTNRRLWVVGDNTNGQLGVNVDDSDFLENWTECTTLGAVQRMFCGPKATLAFANPRQ